MFQNLFSRASLCVVGNLSRDIKTAPLVPTRDLFEDGEDSLATLSETIGGGGANSACCAAALGARVLFLGKVGRDALGRRLEAALRRWGVTPRLARDRRVSTGTTLALSFQTGTRHFLSFSPNNYALTFADLDLARLKSYRQLLRADIWFSPELLFYGNRRLFQAARTLGMTTSIDLNWDPLWGHAAPRVISARKQAEILPLINLAHGNIRELNEFAGSRDLDTTLARLSRWGVEAVVVHMGARGAGFFSQGKLTVVPPARTARQVQTTGTGDLLSVCMMLLHDCSALSVRQRLELSNRIVRDFMEGKLNLIAKVD